MGKFEKLNRLKGLITERESSYRKLSEATGIPLNTLCNKINGKTLFDIVEVSKVCVALDIAPEKIPFFFLNRCETQYRPDREAG